MFITCVSIMIVSVVISVMIIAITIIGYCLRSFDACTSTAAPATRTRDKILPKEMNISLNKAK